MPHAGRSAPLNHPLVERIDLLAVLHALSDPTRMTIVQTLAASPERACGTFPVQVAPSTLTHHFRVLRESGVTGSGKRETGDGHRYAPMISRAAFRVSLKTS